MAAAAILFMQKMMITATLSTLGCPFASAYQIWWESIYLRHRNGTLMKSKIAAAILNFDQMAFLIKWSNSGYHFVPKPKIWTKAPNRGRSYGYFIPKSKMAAVRHFGIVMTSFKTTNVEYLVISWVYLKIWKFSFFSKMACDCPATPPFRGFLGEFDPLNVVHRANLKKAHPCVISRNLSHCAPKSAEESLQ